MIKNIGLAILAVMCIGNGFAQSVYPGQHEGKMKLEVQAPVQVKSFELKNVRLLPSRFRENMMCDSAWMVSIDVNRLIHSFRTSAGVWAGIEGGYESLKKYGGWESLDINVRYYNNVQYNSE